MNNDMIARYGRFVANAFWILECIGVFIVSEIDSRFTIKEVVSVLVLMVIGRILLSSVTTRFYEKTSLFCTLFFSLGVLVAIYFSVKTSSSVFLLLLFFLQWLIVLFFLDRIICMRLLIIQTSALFVLLAWNVFVIHSDYYLNVKEMIFAICCSVFCNWIDLGLIKMLSDQQKRNDNQQQSLDDLLIIVESVYNEAKKTADSKTDFISDMARSINRLNKTIHSMNEVIGREKDIRKIHEYCGIIAETESSIHKMTEEIVIYTRLEKGQIIPQKKEFDFGEILQKILQDSYEQVQSKNLLIRMNVSDDLGRQLIGDSQMVERIIRILLSNAIQYTDRGSIDVDVYRQNDAASEGNALICIDVMDTGRGIKGKDLQKVFDPFYRVEEYNAHNSHNAGLGLYIATKFVNMLDGSITVESEYGKGSIFHLKFVQKWDSKQKQEDNQLYDYLIKTAESIMAKHTNSDDYGEQGKKENSLSDKAMEKNSAFHETSEDKENSSFREIQEDKEELDLPPIEGIKWDVAMQFLASKQAILITLEKLNKSGYESASQLRNYYERIKQKDNEAMSLFEIKVHAIKSNLKMVGAIELSERAKDLEFAAKGSDADFIFANADQFIDDFTDLMTAMGKIPEIASQKKRFRQLYNKEEMMEMLEKVLASMDCFEMELADETMKKLENFDYPEKLLQQIERLSGMVLNLDNDGARECVDRIKELIEQ